MEEAIYTINIDKCRRNVLLNHKYNYCIFNVMDDIKVFNIDNEIIDGLRKQIIISHYVAMVGSGQNEVHFLR